jgi:hemoglobin
MLGIHAGSGADEELATRFVACFVQAADDAQLPADPNLRACLRQYMEWAVGEVDSYSRPGSQVPDGQTMPHWSWLGPE